MANRALIFRVRPANGPVWWAVIVCHTVQGRAWERYVTGRAVRELGERHAASVRRVPRVPRAAARANAVSYHLW